MAWASCLWQAISSSVIRQGEVPGPHPAADLELLTVWTLGQLPEAEENALLEHLSRCDPCRRTVAGLVRSGVLELVAPQIRATPENVTVPESPVSRIRSRRKRWATVGILALAASLLIAIGWLAWRGGPGSEVARPAVVKVEGRARFPRPIRPLEPTPIPRFSPEPPRVVVKEEVHPAENKQVADSSQGAIVRTRRGARWWTVALTAAALVVLAASLTGGALWWRHRRRGRS